MTRLYNDPADFREELIEGFVAAYGRLVQRVPNASGVMVRAPQPDKVAVIIGGGSGHYPAFCGYVGPGLATAAVMGNIFSAPSAEQVYRVTKAVAGAAGVLYSYGNYSGDVLNFDMAQMRCEDEGMDVRTVLVTDDVASAPRGQEEERRGIAGDFYVFKLAGASAARGDNLDEVERLALKTNARTRSFGVAFAGCTLPGQRAPLFTVDAGQMELGLGVHGEPGISTGEMRPAREVADLLLDTLLADVPEGAGSRVAVMLNGLGSTKYEELFVLYKDVHRRLLAEGLELHDPIVNEMVTSLDMAGCSLSLLWLDDELAPLLDAPCTTPAYTIG
ncbi:MAG: dihydroxyacetone kinase subunit DhaK [Caldilinea sp.]|nr:dihydroxyacetone kinase subunit DhaK [Caldilineaceae bacterium]MCB9113932.1 dihydroxyacetone kinase subunit DhaK [Caldilineaceae bacterium]MCB9118576.1 dihydroxyacetone kinase subunit DhaK [Caldilineaceae bacterium]MCO5212873.1 dihydroxyacetone kinase subunit DhaK [Caldilinea sp.]